MKLVLMVSIVLLIALAFGLSVAGLLYRLHKKNIKKQWKPDFNGFPKDWYDQRGLSVEKEMIQKLNESVDDSIARWEKQLENKINQDLNT